LSALPPRRTVVDRLRSAGCVFAEDEAELMMAAADSAAGLEALLARRLAGEPLEQLLGWVEFCGRRLAIEPGVFVPRRRTEFLAREAVVRTRAGDVVVDLCCGCGAVAAAVSAAVPAVEVHAVDVDPAAVHCARRNVPGPVHLGDLYDALPQALRGRVAVLSANTPYVPTSALATMPAEARLYEPRRALDGGPDGLTVLGQVVAGAPDWLAPGGHLLVEASGRQSAAVLARLDAVGLPGEVREDCETEATIVVARAR
jgi:release factor glutamine methyltransferase